jgi:hypothetical protein
MAREIASLLAACRVAEARQIVADQHALIARLTAMDRPTFEAKGWLQTYLSALKLLEAHEDRIREDNKAKRGETRKVRAGSNMAHKLDEPPHRNAGGRHATKRDGSRPTLRSCLTYCASEPNDQRATGAARSK